MTFTIDKLAKTLQTLFTTEADTAAKESGMVQRRRKISGAGFVQSLVFGWLDDPTTTIDELGDELDGKFRGQHTHLPSVPQQFRERDAHLPCFVQCPEFPDSLGFRERSPRRDALVLSVILSSPASLVASGALLEGSRSEWFGANRSRIVHRTKGRDGMP